MSLVERVVGRAVLFSPKRFVASKMFAKVSTHEKRLMFAMVGTHEKRFA
jgi:hypothetical protein